MENKKNLGAYILRRRKELGLTQREFAARLFVTESAVSKWERGISYPDISMVRDICAVLEITEHELLTASDDTQARNAERLAARYLRLMRNIRWSQYILYGAAALGCLLGDWLSDGRVDWFWIVVCAEGMAASLTLLPALLPRYRASAALGGFTLWLMLLLPVCGAYAGTLRWVPVAQLGTLLGMGAVLLPLPLGQLPLPAWIRERKLTVYLAVETALLLSLLAVCAWYGKDGGWLPSALTGTLLGLSLVFAPVALRQLPLPGTAARHKALLYCALETALVLAVLAVSLPNWSVFLGALPLTGYLLLWPWGLLAALRYLPVTRWIRAGAALVWSGVYAVFLPWGVDRCAGFIPGAWTDQPHPLGLRPDFSCWAQPNAVAENVMALIAAGLVLSGLVCCGLGLAARRRGKENAPERD